MPFQLWIQCQRRDVQEVKVLLEKRGQLSRMQKVKAGEKNGYMLIPSNALHDQEVVDLEAQDQMLCSLGLRQLHVDPMTSLVYLPSVSPRIEGQEAKSNPITDTISKWLSTIPEDLQASLAAINTSLLSTTPRRWSVYPPMLLLPSGSFQNPPWPAFLQTVSLSKQEDLWRAILTAVWLKEGGPPLTHLAINSGIPSKQPLLHATTSADPPAAEAENILRSPSGLLPLLGDFGPPISAAAASPSEQDFSSAFWVSSKQNGIQQVWAPRYTMFSRGNVKEKARILSFRSLSPKDSVALGEAERGVGAVSGMGEGKVCVEKDRVNDVAVDLYAGIGYFVFSYVKLGIRKILCWEINPWSVEGLRRGATENGWVVKVVREEHLKAPLWEILRKDEDVAIVVLEESNERAAARILELRHREEDTGMRVLGSVIHVNCGFLPTSEPSWKGAWKAVHKEAESWMHLHENVGMQDIARRKKEIEEKISKWAFDEKCSSLVDVEHVELVKTFAPGVWHCVFDVHISPPPYTTSNS